MNHRLLVGLAVAGLAAPAFAGSLLFDQNVMPDVIFGSGNANGAFTVDRSNGIELGLRGKLRFNASNQPENTFNSNGDGSYNFRPGTPPTGFGFAPNSPTTPVWNFEWSINTDFDGSTGLNLDDLTYVLSIDGDASAGTNFLTFDPINIPAADHAIGDNSTGNGAGAVASSAAEYASLISSNNVAQQSWNYEFFNDAGTALEFFNPNQQGVYTIMLEAFDAAGNRLAMSSIDINIVPLPAGVAMAGAGLFVVGARRRRAL